jgi:hypothetical protein
VQPTVANTTSDVTDLVSQVSRPWSGAPNGPPISFKKTAASISALERSAFAKVPRLYVASAFFFLFRQSAANVQ